MADPRTARINYFEMVGVSTAVERRRRAVLRRYADLAGAQLAGLLPPGDVLPSGDLDIAAVALVSATDGLIIDRLSAGGEGVPDPAEMDRLAGALTDLFATAIGV